MGKALDRFRKQQQKYRMLLETKRDELVATGVELDTATVQATEFATAWSRACNAGRSAGTNKGPKPKIRVKG